MEYDEPPLYHYSGPITAAGVAFEELQTAITKLIYAELKLKYSNATRSSFDWA